MPGRKTRNKHINNEKGAISLEFLGTLPYYFFLFLLLWQVVASGYAILTVRSAVNEAAKVYSLTGDRQEAEDMARSIMSNSSNVLYEGITFDTGSNNFKLHLTSRHSLLFIPAQWRQSASIEIEQTAAGRLIQ